MLGVFNEIKMKKRLLIIIILLTTAILGFAFSVKLKFAEKVTNSETKTEEQKSPEPQNNNEDIDECNNVPDQKKQINEDLNGDDVKELIELSLTGNCVATDYQIFIYKKVPDYGNEKEFYYELLASTNKIKGGSRIAKIEIINFDKQKLLSVDALSLGAHSSSTNIYRYDKKTNKVLLVCRNKEKVGKCEEWQNELSYFFSDAGGVTFEDLEKDGNPEVIELLRIYPNTSTDKKMDFKSYISSISRYNTDSQMFQGVTGSELDRLSEIVINNFAAKDELYSLKEYEATRLYEEKPSQN